MIATLFVTVCASVGALVLGAGSLLLACKILQVVTRGIGGAR